MVSFSGFARNVYEHVIIILCLFLFQITNYKNKLENTMNVNNYNYDTNKLYKVFKYSPTPKNKVYLIIIQCIFLTTYLYSVILVSTSQYSLKKIKLA